MRCWGSVPTQCGRGYAVRELALAMWDATNRDTSIEGNGVPILARVLVWVLVRKAHVTPVALLSVGTVVPCM